MNNRKTRSRHTKSNENSTELNGENIHTSQTASTSTSSTSITSDSSIETIVQNPSWIEENSENITDYPDIETIKKMGWDIYTSKEKELRYLLHMEYLNQYMEEEIIPKGLTINLKPSINEENFVNSWNKILTNASNDLMRLLIKHYNKELQETINKRTEIDRKMDQVWTNDDKENFFC